MSRCSKVGACIGVLYGLFVIAESVSKNRYLPWTGGEAITQNVISIATSSILSVLTFWFLGWIVGCVVSLFRRKDQKQNETERPTSTASNS